MSKFYFLSGLPGSGKTHWAKDYLNKNPNTIRVNKDDLRSMMISQWSKDKEQHILQARDAIITSATQAQLDIIVDDTNFEPKHKERMQDLCPYDYDFIELRLDTPLEECIKRDKTRPKPVSESVIRTMHKKYLTKPIDHDKIIQSQELPKAIIVDLDGTLALHNGRGPFDYDKCDTDLVNKPVRDLLNIIIGYKTHEIIFMSGRDDSCREKTEKWLQQPEVIGDHPHQLHMRTTGDKRKDSIMKKELFDTHVKDKYYVDFVLDDRNSVCAMWRELGLTCLQVAEGNF